MIRILRVLAAAGAILCGHAYGHDLITAEVTDRYLATVSSNVAAMRSAAPAPRRAQAAYQLGRTLDEIRDYFNRDIAAHGKVVGLASNRLVLELTARGAPLRQFSDGRFAANLSYYREALALDPGGPHEADALFRLVQGYFYDSFDQDPLLPRQQSWEQLKQQIDYAERLLDRQPPYPEAEEARFILLVHHVQAALGAPEMRLAREHAVQARTAMATFERLYPESLRAAALPMLSERLQGK